MAQGKLIQSFASLINRMKDSLPKKATIVRVDHSTVDLRLGPGTGIIHNVEVMGDPDGLYPGLVVPIEWLDRAGGYLLPVVMHSGSGTVTTAGKVPSLMADNRTLRIEGGAMQVQDNSIQLRHLGFAPALADHTHPEMFAGLGWSFGSGVISSTLGSVVLENEGRIRVGNGHNTIVLDSVHADYRLWAGNTDPTLASFSITAGGALNASGAEISGTVHAGSGEIGGWAIGATSLASGSFKLDSQVPALLIGSASGYMAGEGVFLGYSGSEYKLHIGNPNGSHLAWDGNTLNITGSVFASANVIGAIGGALIVSKQQGRLSSDVGTSAAQVDFGQVMAVGDYIHLKAFDVNGAAREEVLKILSLASGTTYNVTRDVQGANNPDPAWPKDTLWVAKGKQGDGWIEIGDFGVNRIKMRQFTGPNFSDDKEYLRLGEMTGWQGAGLTGMGLGIGDYAGNKYLSYSPAAGLTVRGSIKADSGYLDALDISGQLTVQNTGSIVMGSTNTGIVLGYQSNGHYLRGVNAGSTEFEIRASDGKAYAGAGNVTLDRDGVWFKDVAEGAAPIIHFTSDGSQGSGGISGWRVGTNNDYKVRMYAEQPPSRGSTASSAEVSTLYPFTVWAGNPQRAFFQINSSSNATLGGTLTATGLQIGSTGSRQSTLQVNGTIQTSSEYKFSIEDYYNGIPSYPFKIYAAASFPNASDNKMHFYVANAAYWGATEADRQSCVLTLGGNGYVGIGTQSPAFPLHIYNPSTGGAIAFNSAAIRIGAGQADHEASLAGYARPDTSFTNAGGIVRCGGPSRGDNSQNAIMFYNNSGAESMRIDGTFTGHTAGNVGIATDTPLKRFSVAGFNGLQMGFNPGPASPEVGRLFWFSDNTGWKMSIGHFHTVTGVFTTRMQMSDSGSVMVGTTTDGMTGGGSLAIAQDLAHRGSKVGFYNVTPVARPNTALASATFATGGGTAVNSNATFGGYTIGQIVTALKQVGLLT